jgi:uncharacterized protein
MNRFVPAGAAALALLAVALLAAGCATHAERRARVETAMARGDYAAALTELDRTQQDPQDVLYLLDRGLLLHYLERYPESNRAFETAETRIQDLYTRSVSRQAVSLLTSDVVIPYDGAPFERALIHYYRTLNYVYDHDLEGALVECRKANLLLAILGDRTEGRKTAYRDDAFLEYLGALLYQDAGEWNDAWVSLRAADSAYARYAIAFGVAPPGALGCDLRRMARVMGDDAYPTRVATPCDTLPDGYGELVFLFENGLAPVKEQVDIALPILKGEAERYREDRDGFALLLAGRYDGYAYREAELDYLLHVAIPRIRPRPPLARYAEVSAGETVATTVVVEDVSALSRAALSEAMPRILLKTVLRGITKYVATRGVRKETGEIGGLLANLITAATERADTRGWITLPDDIQMARLPLPAGAHRVRVRLFDEAGAMITAAEVGAVTIVPGRRTYLSWRGWD